MRHRSVQRTSTNDEPDLSRKLGFRPSVCLSVLSVGRVIQLTDKWRVRLTTEAVSVRPSVYGTSSTMDKDK